MTPEETTDARDMAFAEFQASLPQDCASSSIGRMHYCSYCHEPLALCVLAQSPDEDSLVSCCQRKTPPMTERIGADLQIPIYKIAFADEPVPVAAVMQVGRPEIRMMNDDEFVDFIDEIHNCPSCRELQRGRFA